MPCNPRQRLLTIHSKGRKRTGTVCYTVLRLIPSASGVQNSHQNYVNNAHFQQEQVRQYAPYIISSSPLDLSLTTAVAVVSLCSHSINLVCKTRRYS
jgi:hypothetical protein